jgi:hypothetical protein
MDQAIRNSLQNATQQARRLLEQDIAEQLEGTFDVMANGAIADTPGKHLDASQRLVRTKLVETIRHRAGGSTVADKLADAVSDYIREAAFTILNRYIALKMLEVRGLVQQCISKGDQSSGFKEFCLAAPGLAMLPDKGYRLYLECLFDELSIEVKSLFDRHDHASLLWPRRQAFDALLAILNADELAGVWKEDETIGWVYQYFNSQEERRAMREASQAPRNSRELAVRNQFFTPRYVVEFLTDNTLGRIWYEMRRGQTALADQCRYLVRRPTEIFLGDPQLSAIRLMGKPEEGDRHEVPATVEAAFNGDLGPALEETVGAYRWWVGLAIPPDQYEKITGQKLGQLMDYSLVSDVLSILRDRPDAPELTDPIRIWAALSHMALTSSGGPYALEPSRLLWEGLKRAHEADTKRERTQEELLLQPALVPFRAKKDPRDLKILDPACGSSHFLLYCFDLLLTIYEEAWRDEESPASEISGKSLREDYETIEALRAEVPGLILRHNLHGIDIDPRCAQIGAFALWMRAQRAYGDFNIPKDQRPPITRSNIVVAEPMPGEEDLFEEFLRSLKEDRLESLIRDALKVPANKQVRATKAMADSLCDLVRTIWDTMKLAGEAGSLLNVFRELESAIAKGREEWEQQLPLFRVTEYELRAAPKTSLLRAIPGEDADFWSKSEVLVLRALDLFTSQAGRDGNQSIRHGLFAGDATRGIAFIHQVRMHFDVVLMNPPFGNPTPSARRYLSREYPYIWSDLYAAFIRMASDRLTSNGRMGAITSRTFLALDSFETLRDLLLSNCTLIAVAECGLGVLDDATVRAAFTIAEQRTTKQHSTPIFWDLKRSGDRETDLLGAVIWQRPLLTFLVPANSIRQIPGKPFAYWLPPKLLSLLTRGPFLDGTRIDRLPSTIGARVAVGASTTDDFRFVRCHWEVQSASIGEQAWCRFAHASGFFRFYAPVYAVIRWHGNGRELLAVVDDSGNTKPRLRCEEHFFKRGLLTPYISERGLACGLLPADHIVSNSCRGIFDEKCDHFALMAILNSAFVDVCLWALTPDRKHEAGLIAALPLPDVCASDLETLASLGKRAWLVARQLRSLDETDPWHWFSFLEAPDAAASASTELADLFDQIDAETPRFLGLERETITAAFTASGAPHDSGLGDQFNESVGDREDDDDVGVRDTIEWRWMSLSHALGVGLGRWELSSLLSGVPTELWRSDLTNTPSVPLLCCQQADQRATGNEYGAHSTPDRILVDDAGGAHDVSAALIAVFDLVPVDAREALGIRLYDDVSVLRDDLARRFFGVHLSQYTRSRRKAPIYWQLATPTASYSVWLYYHCVTADVFYKVLNDYVKPKRDHEQHKLDRLHADAGPEPTRSQRAEIDDQDTFVAELQTFVEHIEMIVPLWNPNLNDGVIINFAPLWRLVSHHKAWQKECKECWDSLGAGEYDWAYLAMHLWPERVVPKCHRDASIAIAHGLDDLFWIMEDDTWRALRTPSAETEDQKKRRTTAVREQLLSAFAELAKSEVGAQSTSSVWQRFRDGELDDQRAALWLWPGRVIEKARYDQTIANVHEIKQREVESTRACEQLKKRFNTSELEQLRAAAEAFFGGRDTALRTTWEALSRGELDSEALALELWPDRVIDKCLEDVNLAEKLNLRDYFWYNAPDKGWRPRQDPADEIAWESSRRYNRTVKDALEKFLAAPTSDGGNKRGRTKAAKATAIVDDAPRVAAGKRKPKVAKVRNESEELF